MLEKYKGRKFKTIFRKKVKVGRSRETDKLLYWCRRLSKLGFAPKYDGGSYGNLSFKDGASFIITAGGVDLESIKQEKLVRVINCKLDKKEVYVEGLQEPSSETILHWLIYKKRRDARAIFHGHSQIVLEHAEELKLPITKKEYPYGTIKLAKEVVKILDNNDVVLMRNHGFIIIGDSIQKAGKLLLKMYNKIQSFFVMNSV